MLPTLETGPLAQAVGWALFHSAWQLIVIAALLWGTLVLLRRASALTRYWVSVSALFAGAALPALTALGVLARLEGSGPAATGLAGSLPWVGWLPQAGAEASAALATGGALSERVAAILPTLTVLWLLAVTVLSARLVLGWSSVQRLGRQRTRRLPVQLTRRFYRVARGLGVRGVRFLESRAVDVPMVVGWLSPVVLIPAAAVLRLAPHELESVVAHELAHVARRDYLVNLIQTVVETMLFFHPAVWWISKRIREERECCCDDTAVSTCGDALAYARALTQLESLRAGLPRLAMGATGGVLLERVRRLVRPESRRSANTRRDLGGLVVLLSTTVLLVGTGLSVGAPAVEEPAPEPQARMLTAIMIVGESTDARTDEVLQRAHARLRVRLGVEDLPTPLPGGGLFRLAGEIETDAEIELLTSLTADLDDPWLAQVEHFDGHALAGAREFRDVMVFSAGEGQPGDAQLGHWTVDFDLQSSMQTPQGFTSKGLPDDLPEEVREHLEQLLDGQQPATGATSYRKLFILRSETLSPGSELAPPPLVEAAG